MEGELHTGLGARPLATQPLPRTCSRIVCAIIKWQYNRQLGSYAMYLYIQTEVSCLRLFVVVYKLVISVSMNSYHGIYIRVPSFIVMEMKLHKGWNL